MSCFLIGEGVEISVGGITYTGDERGVVEIPSEHDEALVNRHGLTMYVEAPAEAVETVAEVAEVVEPAAAVVETVEASASKRSRKATAETAAE